jgi:hypothetical protein
MTLVGDVTAGFMETAVYAAALCGFLAGLFRRKK